MNPEGQGYGFSGWSEKVIQSAGGFAKDLITSGGAYGTTGDLETLRAAHKLSGLAQQNDLAIQERYPKPLSKRHQANEQFRSRNYSPVSSKDVEIEEDLLDFLERQCSLADQSSSSSRSTTPSYALDAQSDYATAGPSTRESANISTTPGYSSGSNGPYGDSTDVTTSSNAMLAEFLEAQNGVCTPDYIGGLWKNHRSLFREDLTSALAQQEAAQATREEQRKQRAVRRVDLVSNHLNLSSTLCWKQLASPLATTALDPNGLLLERSHGYQSTAPWTVPSSVPVLDPRLSQFEHSEEHLARLLHRTPPALDRNFPYFERTDNHLSHILGALALHSTTPTLNPNFAHFETSNEHVSSLLRSTSGTTSQSPLNESSYNQLCHGESSAEWAEYENSLAAQALSQSQSQSQTQDNVAEQAEQNWSWRETYENHLAEELASTTGFEAMQSTRSHADVAQDSETQQEQQKQQQQEPTIDAEEPPLPPFHCPWIGCDHYLQTNYQYRHDPVTGALEALACIHVGCDDAFAEAALWREHIFEPHHGLLAPVPVGVLEREGEHVSAEMEMET